MKITPINNYNYSLRNFETTRAELPVKSTASQEIRLPDASNYKANFLPSFTSISISDEKGTPLCSGFYRDYPTLFAVKKYIEKNFEDGCNIVVGACSSGEDLISLYSMLDDREKYNFLGIDMSEGAIEIANENIYGISEFCRDGFLLDRVSGKEKELKQKFMEVMYPTKGCGKVLNLHPVFGEVTNIYCSVRPEHLKKIKFICMDLCDYKPDSPAGVIFFRNGLYQISENYLENVLYTPDYRPDNNNKKEALRPIISAIYENLADNGILVIGSVPAEHFYVADNYLDESQKIIVDKVKFFDNAIDYNLANPEVEIYKKSPLYDLLLEDGKFKPIYKSQANLEEKKVKVPTIWKKVK